jgi:hypothetical protein
MTIAAGHRFEATQALRQVLNRAVEWGLIDVNPAKQGVDNPQRRRTEKRPFESWAEIDALAEHGRLKSTKTRRSMRAVPPPARRRTPRSRRLLP